MEDLLCRPERWTVPSEHWESVDWGLFTGNPEYSEIFAGRKMDFVRKTGSGRMIMPDCGGASFGCRMGMNRCAQRDPSQKVDYVYLYDYLEELIRAGRITLDKKVNAGAVFTWHDSCKHGRELERHFGKGFYEEPRWIMGQCVDRFVEMEPNRAGAFCCGAGGGLWPSPYEKESAYQSRMKHRSIMETGADVVVVGCSNCRDQLMRRVPGHYSGRPYRVKYLWELVADSLVVTPWSDEEIEKARAEEEAQWAALGVDVSGPVG